MSYDHYRPDPGLRLMKHGKLLPMDQPRPRGLSRRAWERLYAATLAALVAIALTMVML